MVRAIKERVIVGEGGRIEIARSELPEGGKADVIVVLDEQSTNDEPAGKEPNLSGLQGSNEDQLNTPEEVDAYLQKLRKEWDKDEERRRPLSYYFGKAKGGFKDAAEADAFIRAERDAWDD